MELVHEARVDPVPMQEEISDSGAAAMARASVNLFRHWGLTDAEACVLLGGISESKYNNWKKGRTGRLGVDLRARLSILMGAHKALRILYTENARAYAWVKSPNGDLGEQRPLDIMLRGNLADLYAIRQYLDAARGW